MSKRRGPQDIARASKLKAYRSKLAQAKRLGVVSARIDARSHKPTRYMKSRLKFLEPVLEGRYAAVKAKPSVLREFRSAGARIANGRILVEARPEVITTVRRGTITEGVIFQRRPLDAGFWEELITLPISSHNVGDMLSWLATNGKSLQGKKNSGDRWGFKIDGNRSRASFGGFEEMVDYLTYYKNIGAIEDVDTGEHPEFFTIWRIKEPQWTRAAVQADKDRDLARRRRRTVQERSGERPSGYRERPAPKTGAERMRTMREGMTLSQREEIKTVERARLKSFRAKKKG